jgi:hypothetical protein
MKEFFVSDCVQYENKIITSTFVVVSRQVKPKKSGEPYLAFTLGDRSGHIEAKMWDNVEDAIDACDQDDFIKVKGLINKYKNRFQLTIHKLRRMGESEVDFADYLPKTRKDIGELWQTLAGYVATFQDPHLKAWLRLSWRTRNRGSLPQRSAQDSTSCLLAVCSSMWSRFSIPANSCAAIIRRSTATCFSPAPSFTISARSTS